MTQENKKLLLKDLCARQPYSVFLYHEKYEKENTIWKLDTKADVTLVIEDGWLPYLRPMSSMTEEEYKELKKISNYYGFAPFECIYDWEPNYEMTDWLNANHFDYRGLIEKGLAIKAPEGMYNFNLSEAI